jgi:NTE family protein
MVVRYCQKVVDNAMITQTRIILNTIQIERFCCARPAKADPTGPKNGLARPLPHRFWVGRAALASALLALAACTTTPPLPAPPTTPTPPTVQPPVVQPVPKRPPKIGLALGGGAARGFAHVGVIQVLEENGIAVDYLAGTSAGSLVAAIYASGKNGKQLQQVAESMDEAAITDWQLPFVSRGMLRGEALARYVSEQVGGKTIEQMRPALGIVATDLGSGLGVLFQRGDAATAVRASSAVPSVFQPVRIGGREYVDGGLVSPVPVRYARQMGAELVIAVDISAAPEANLAQSNLQILLQTFAIMGKSINNFELKEADLLVRPSLAGAGGADFAAKRKTIEAGRAAMLAALPQLKAAMEKLAR